MLSTGNTIPKKNILISSGNGKQKAALLDAAKYLRENGYNIYATEGTYRHLVENGIESTRAYWPDQEGAPQALDLLHNHEIDLCGEHPHEE